ncbi:unnamed protein product [Symbiodinium natans]|uniref:Uncharacterized protein n=1 Tax=Symbiodinium natans TaxID=878477 RepID=A0A812SMD7_9DINO|nr:unnamed protein product [Symbiodinium natans]
MPEDPPLPSGVRCLATGNALEGEGEEEPEEVDQPFLDIVAAGRTEEADLSGYDAMFPALFAAADGMVLCTSHAFAEDAWCRLYLSLGYAFLPTGRLMYEVDRNLVHISRLSVQVEDGREET